MSMWAAIGETAREAKERIVSSIPGEVGPFVSGLVVLTGLAVAWKFWKQRLEQAGKALPPGSFGWPVLGETLAFVKDPAMFTLERLARFGGTFKTNFLFNKTVVLAPTPSNLKFFIKESNNGWPEHWKALFGYTSLPMVNGEAHVRLRKESTKAFTDELLNKYLSVMQSYTEANLTIWASRGGEAKDIFFDCKLHTLAIAQHVLIGMKMTAERLSKYAELYENLMHGLSSIIPIDLPFLPFGKAMGCRRALVREYRAVLSERRGALAAGAPPECMLDSLVKHSAMSETEMMDFIISMVFAGHDTSTASMQTALYYLKSAPGAAQLEAELRAEVDKAWDGASVISRQTLKKVPRVHAFIQETMRLCPPVQMIIRQVTRDLEVDGFLIPKGYQVAGSIVSIGQTLEEPGSFDVRRHLDSDGQFNDKVFQIGTPAFGTFGGGVHHCIGHRFARDELSIFLLVLLRKYDYKLESATHELFAFHFWRVKVAFMERPSGK